MENLLIVFCKIKFYKCNIKHNTLDVQGRGEEFLKFGQYQIMRWGGV